MNRNDRYRRRGEGFSCQRDRSAELAAAAAVNTDEANCLCDAQPISYAMAYVKSQPFGEVYNKAQALYNGTLFPELNKPYCMGGRKR